MRRFYWPTATKAKAINRARQEKLTNEGQAMKEGLEYEKMFISQQGFNNIIERLKFATLRLVVPTTPRSRAIVAPKRATLYVGGMANAWRDLACLGDHAKLLV